MWDKLQILYTKDNIFDEKEAKVVKDLKKGSSNCKDLKYGFVSVKILEENQDKEGGSLYDKVRLAKDTKDGISKNEDKEHEEYEDKEGEVYLEEELMCGLNKIKNLMKMNLKQKKQLQTHEEEDYDSKSKIYQTIKEIKNIIMNLNAQL